MSALVPLLSLLAAGAVLVRCVCIAARLNRRDWSGHPLRFVGMAAGYALTGGGAVGTALEWDFASHLLLFGMAGLVVFERRAAC